MPRITWVRTLLSKAALARVRTAWRDPYHGIVYDGGPAIERDYMVLRKVDVAVLLRRSGYLREMER